MNVQVVAAESAGDVWHPPRARAMLRWPAEHLPPVDRFLFRAFAAAASRQVRAIHGLRHLTAAADPFILVANHTTFCESFLVPALLMVLRRGRRIYFIADWNFRIIPGGGFIARRGQVITHAHKDSWYPVLNVFRRFYEEPATVMERAHQHLVAGKSIGVFPEGDMTRDARHLLPGRNGAARLSLQTGAAVIPVGIRFPGADPDKPVGEREPMELHIGAALHPPPVDKPSLAEVRDWHGVMMTEIASLSARTWSPQRSKRRFPSRTGSQGQRG